MTQHIETVAFRPARRKERVDCSLAQQARLKRAARRKRQLAERHPATVARRLALAHRIAGDIESGHYADQADVARHHGLTRARLTQLMNLLLLAPDIQEEVLALEYPAGREPITERTLRRVLRSLVWEHQRALWTELPPEPYLLGSNPVRHGPYRATPGPNPTKSGRTTLTQLHSSCKRARSREVRRAAPAGSTTLGRSASDGRSVATSRGQRGVPRRQKRHRVHLGFVQGHGRPPRRAVLEDKDRGDRRLGSGGWSTERSQGRR